MKPSLSRKHKQDEHDEQESMLSLGGPEIFDRDGPIWVNKFTEDSARAFVKQLMYQAQNPEAPIVIHIDSYGGDVYSALTMIAALESIPNQIITVAFGKAMSAGALLLAHGHIRYASEHSTLMIHEVSAGAGGHIADMNTQYTNIAQLNDKLLKMLAKRCKIKGGAPALKKLYEKDRDLYLTPEQAVKFGLIDKIGIPTLHRKVAVQWGLLTPPRNQEAQENEQPAVQPKQPTRKPSKA